jgi:predicted transcriptional regulator
MDDRPHLSSAGDGFSAASPNTDLEVRRVELRAAVKRGLEDIEAGRVVDLEAAFDRIEAMLDELEAGKRV